MHESLTKSWLLYLQVLYDLCLAYILEASSAASHSIFYELRIIVGRENDGFLLTTYAKRSVQR